ncbi:hypothetical protein PFISCL1PPCAC_194, partial [Pristionchus fissidentatus]
SMEADNVDLAAMVDECPNVVFHEQRKASFDRASWCYDKQKNAICTSDKLAAAGFHYTGTKADPSAAACAFCLKEMLFDDTDDPWEEHVSHSPSCFFVRLNQHDEKQLTMQQFLQLVAYRKSKLYGKWMRSQIDQFQTAVNYVAEMKPK